MKNDEKWVTPKWMKDYLDFLPNGNRIEELMNSKATTFENAPMALLVMETKGAVYTLTKMHNAGFLSAEADGEC